MTYSTKQAKRIVTEAPELYTMTYAQEREIQAQVLAVTDPERIRRLEDAMDAQWDKVHWVRETSSDAQLAWMLAEHGGQEGALRHARYITRMMDERTTGCY